MRRLRPVSTDLTLLSRPAYVQYMVMLPSVHLRRSSQIPKAHRTLSFNAGDLFSDRATDLIRFLVSPVIQSRALASERAEQQRLACGPKLCYRIQNATTNFDINNLIRFHRDLVKCEAEKLDQFSATPKSNAPWSTIMITNFDTN